MDLEGKTLRDWLADAPKHQFPGGGAPDYWKRFEALEDYLNTYVHKHVTAGAMIADGGYLTDHGPDHIRTVIQRASDLARSPHFTLTPYEAYLFLAATHIHDVGNIFARATHEITSEEVMEKLGLLLGEDRVEQIAIHSIAGAHGGTIDGDKDKIRRLAPEDYIMGATIRPRTLAALLRFADELADDRSRAARFLLELGKVPKSSEVYHQYASALHSVVARVPGDTVELRFSMTKDDACRTFGKGSDQVYLLDEIFERAVKMHRERMYCMRFLRPEISVERIRVKVEVFGPKFSGTPKVIPFSLEEAGYPELPGRTIHALCPELTDHGFGGEINGAALHQVLAKGDA